MVRSDSLEPEMEDLLGLEVTRLTITIVLLVQLRHVTMLHDKLLMYMLYWAPGCKTFQRCDSSYVLTCFGTMNKVLFFCLS